MGKGQARNDRIPSTRECLIILSPFERAMAVLCGGGHQALLYPRPAAVHWPAVRCARKFPVGQLCSAGRRRCSSGFSSPSSTSAPAGSAGAGNGQRAGAGRSLGPSWKTLWLPGQFCAALCARRCDDVGSGRARGMPRALRLTGLQRRERREVLAAGDLAVSHGYGNS